MNAVFRSLKIDAVLHNFQKYYPMATNKKLSISYNVCPNSQNDPTLFLVGNQMSDEDESMLGNIFFREARVNMEGARVFGVRVYSSLVT